MRFLYVPGVTPGKWMNRWQERLPGVALESILVQDDVEANLARLSAGEAELAFLRIPSGEADQLKAGRYVIPLYEEQTAVVAAKGHEITAFDELSLDELSDERFFDSSVAGIRELGGLEMALNVVASGAGLMVLPMPAVRHLNNPDVVARKVNGAATTQIVLLWHQDVDSDEIQEFVGIVRGRKADSGRQPSVTAQQQADAAKARKKRSSDAGARGSAGRGAGGKSGSKSASLNGKAPRKGGPRSGSKPGGKGRKR